MKKIVLSLAAIVLSTGLFVANAEKPEREHKRKMVKKHMMQDHSPMRGKRAHSRVAQFLTEEQKEVFKKSRIETSKKTQPLKNELRELKAQYVSLISVENPNFKDLDANIDASMEIRTELAKIKARQQVAFKEMLTDEQKLKMENRKKKGPRKGHKQRRAKV